MKKKVLMLSLLPCLLGISSCGDTDADKNITYQYDIGEGDMCCVYRNDSADVETKYLNGWSLTQYGDVYFELKSEEKKIVYSNSRYGYKISISLLGQRAI